MLTRFYLRPDLRHDEKNGQGVNFMDSIFTRTLADGTLRYRAVIRVHRKDYPIFRESKTFNSRRKADSWLKKREVEIEANLNILYGNQP